jgi:hypothetical protein
MKALTMILKHKKQLLLIMIGILTGIILDKYTSLSFPHAIASGSSASEITNSNVQNTHQKIEKLGKILAVESHPENNFDAWLVQAPNGKKMTLYTTGDIVFSGTLWNIQTKENLNVVFNPSNSNISPVSNNPINQNSTANIDTDSTGLISKNFQGQIPEAIKALDSLGGIKIGNAGPADTLYIIIDPRCPYCHQAYVALKPYMDKGVSIKWIPTVALGNSEEGLPMANAILHAQNRTELDKIMSNPQMHTKDLSQTDRDTLNRNLAYMFQVFKQNGDQQAGVPVSFFVDKTSGQPRMMMGISEMAIIEMILGK